MKNLHQGRNSKIYARKNMVIQNATNYNNIKLGKIKIYIWNDGII